MGKNQLVEDARIIQEIDVIRHSDLNYIQKL